MMTIANKNTQKTLGLIAGFLIFVIGVGYVFSYVLESPDILIFAVVFSVLMSFGSYWFSDKLVLMLSRAKPVKPEENPTFYRAVNNLATKAGLPMPKLYIIEEMAPNAFATGRNAQHAVVAVTRGLLNRLDQAELEGVLAHELSHIKNKDMLLSTMIVTLVGLVALLSRFFMYRTFFGGFGQRDDRNSGQLGAIMAMVALIMAILAPLIATIIRLAISRKREFLADASGAQLTGQPLALASALQKISADPTPLRTANNATAHLYITHPFKGKNISKLFMTHPPIEERIKALKELKL
jgi:heat shock protein HtpX